MHGFAARRIAVRSAYLLFCLVRSVLVVLACNAGEPFGALPHRGVTSAYGWCSLHTTATLSITNHQKPPTLAANLPLEANASQAKQSQAKPGQTR